MIAVVGHRGAKGEAPENTIQGFEHARKVGVTTFELDVHLSADKELAVIHDATVDRTTNETGNVSEFTAAQLAQLDARGTCPDWPEKVGVPTLDEVFEAFGNSPTYHVEIKHDEPEALEIVCRKLIEIFERYGVKDRINVTSFDPVALEIMLRIAPEMPRAYIGAYDKPEFLETALRLKCQRAHIPLRTGSKAVVQQAHDHGMHVNGWVGNTAESLDTLLGWGVDSLTSDYPSFAIPYLRDRGKFNESGTKS